MKMTTKMRRAATTYGFVMRGTWRARCTNPIANPSTWSRDTRIQRQSSSPVRNSPFKSRWWWRHAAYCSAAYGDMLLLAQARVHQPPLDKAAFVCYSPCFAWLCFRPSWAGRANSEQRRRHVPLQEACCTAAGTDRAQQERTFGRS